MTARYERTLDTNIEPLLSEDGPLRFLIADVHALSAEPSALDIQLREGNKLMYYHGTTRLLTITFSKSTRRGVLSVKANAAEAYGTYETCGQEYNELTKRKWLLSESNDLKQAWQAYLVAAQKGAVSDFFGNQREGYWQNRLCVQLGMNWTPDDDWLVIDRECVIGFGDKIERANFYEETKQRLFTIKHNLQRDDPDRWGKVGGKGLGPELDLLAINKAGELITIELKDGDNPSGIYWGPLQVGLYYFAFKTALPRVVGGIKRLASQKIRLGLLPQSATHRIQNSSLNIGTPVLAIAGPNKRSSCWPQLLEVSAKLLQQEKIPLNITLCSVKKNNMELRTCNAGTQELQSLLSAGS